MLKQTLFRTARLLRLDAALRRAHRGELKVLMYHNVETGTPRFDYAIPAEEFHRHLTFLKSTCNVVGMTQAGEVTGMVDDRLNVLLTFDDGFANNHDVALPILLDHGLTAVFFLIVDCLATGAPPAYQLARLKSGEDADDWRTVTTQQMLAMRRAGMTIGSHTLAHQDSRTLADDVLVDQARTAREKLEALLGEPVGCHALPWGYHNPGQPERLLEVFERVFLTRHGFCHGQARILPRNEVSGWDHLPHAVSGTLDLLRRAG